MRISKLCSGGKGISLRHGKQLLRCLPLVGMLFATSSVNAADNPGGVKFNSGVRYSQWAINSRLNDFKESTNNCGFDLYDKDGKLQKAATKWSKVDGKLNKRFHYVPGLVAKAVLESADFYEGFDWSKSWFYSAQAYAEEVTYANSTTAPTLDAMNAVKMYFPILSSSLKSSNVTSKANTAISQLASDIKNYNDNFSIGSNSSSLKEADANAQQKGMLGGWYHKSTGYEDQMWLDGAYMGSATLAQLAEYYKGSTNIFGSTTADWDMVTKQLNIVWNYCWDSNKQLMYHAFSATGDAKAQDGGTDIWAGLSKTKQVYHSAAFWGRANAWYFFALVDALEAMKNCNQESTENYKTLKSHLDAFAAGILKWQDTKTGGWFQVMDHDGNYTASSYSGETWISSYNNYIETSASSIFAAAMFKAVRLGLLGDTYKTAAKNAFEGIVNNFVSLNQDDGTINIWSSSRSAGLGGKSYRDGSNEYYILGKDTKRVLKDENITEGKVLGGFIMAATEYERAYQNQNQDNKQILFAKDLAPTYTINSSADVIDATAYGTDAEKATYQWYKDGKAVADATSATFSPKESGEYYCTATVGNNTIQTSTTTVTAKAATEGGNTSGETTAPSGKATFATADLKLLDSAPKEGEKQSLTVGNITITATSGIEACADGLKFNGNSKVSISGINNAKITKIIVEQSTKTRECTFNPNYTSKSNVDKTFTYSFDKQGNIVLTGPSSSMYFTKITVEYENEIVKTNLTASFSQTTIDATEGDASVDVPPLTVKAGDNDFTDYKAEYTTAHANVAKVEDGKVVFVGEGTTTISVNIIPNNTTLYNGCNAEFTVNVKEKTVTPVEPTETKNVYDFKTGVGTTKSGNTAIEVNTDNIVFGANYKPAEGKYITITPNEGGFKVGDVITIKGTSTKGNALMTLNSTLDSETSEQYQFNALGRTETTYQYLLQADCPVLYLGRAYGSTATITGLTVTRAAAAENKTRLVATFPSNSITVVNTTRTVELPKLTVKDGDTELTNKQYTVEKESDNPAVATINGDEITINGIGTATIFAIITPIDQKNYEGCTATYQVTVKEPTPLSVSTMDVTMNTVDAKVKQPVIKVYGDNDKLLTLGKDYTLTYSVDGTNVTVDKAGVFSVTGSAYNWTEGNSKVTVTATPTTALGETYTAGSLTFEYNVIKGKITPVFHESFNGATIRVKTDTKKDKTFSVPLIYDGEDVSEYFDYTYTINDKTPVEINTNNKVSGNTLTFRPAKAGTYTIKVTAKPNTGKENDDADDYSQVYNEPVGISFTVNVGNFTRPTVTVDPSTMTMYTGTFESAADVTVMNGKDIMPDNEYKLAWRSFTPGIVKVDADGNIEAVSEGNGDIRVSVYGENLETMTAFLKVYVDNPALYRAKTKDNDGKEVKYGNQRVMWNQDKTMSVSLGGWMFPNDVTVTNETTTEALSSKNKWEDAASQAKWKLTGFDHVVLSEKSQNARQENGSNAMPESTDIYNATFEKKGTVVDKMFNVPCTGSYLAFNPATNGLVRVHIFQSGAFDSANKNYVYRPQRRVFVMDEAGNFVESRAEIENANGKPKGGVKTLDNYKWDLNSDNAPSLDEVKKHFPKLPTSFAMTDAGFQNNVMESGLESSVVPNNVPTNHDGKSGANGWCVLADSPVTYSFRVKAGKTYYLYNFGSKIGFYGYSFEEDATKPKVDEVNYYEAATNTVTPTEEGHVAKVTINRSFEAGKWTTCVLPFSLNKHQVDAIFGTTYGITNDGTGTTNNNENGTQILYFDRVEGNKAYFVRHAYNTIVAGKPFLIKPANDVESINTAAVTDYPYVTIENTQPAEWCAGNGYAWVSSYSNDMTVKEGDCFISNKDGHFKNYVGDPGTLKGFRGYLKANLANGAKPQTLSVGMDSNVNEEGTSAIIGLTIDADGNIVTGVADGKVYNVNGQVVSEDSRNFGALPSGVYVINGKKYVK